MGFKDATKSFVKNHYPEFIAAPVGLYDTYKGLASMPDTSSTADHMSQIASAGTQGIIEGLAVDLALRRNFLTAGALELINRGVLGGMVHDNDRLLRSSTLGSSHIEDPLWKWIYGKNRKPEDTAEENGAKANQQAPTQTPTTTTTTTTTQQPPKATKQENSQSEQPVQQQPTQQVAQKQPVQQQPAQAQETKVAPKTGTVYRVPSRTFWKEATPEKIAAMRNTADFKRSLQDYANRTDISDAEKERRAAADVMELQRRKERKKQGQ